MIKLIVFDWNGTLIADTKVSLDANNHVLKTFGGKPVNLKAYRKTIIIPQTNFYVKHGCDQKLVSNHEKLNKIFHEYFESRALKCRSRKFAKKLLQWLSDYSIKSVIVSNHTVEGIENQLKRLKLNKYILTILANSANDSSFKGKNKFQRLHAFLNSNKYKSKEIIIVGDSPEEIEMGKKLGIKTVAFTQGDYAISRLKKYNPDYLVNNLGKIIDIIKKI